MQRSGRIYTINIYNIIIIYIYIWCIYIYTWDSLLPTSLVLFVSGLRSESVSWIHSIHSIHSPWTILHSHQQLLAMWSQSSCLSLQLQVSHGDDRTTLQQHHGTLARSQADAAPKAGQWTILNPHLWGKRHSVWCAHYATVITEGYWRYD